MSNTTLGSTLPSAEQAEKNSRTRYLITIFGITFNIFMIMGISLGVLPSYVHNTLGFSNMVVGLVVGIQYAATLLTRQSAGKMSDTKGGKLSISLGLTLTGLAGILMLAAVWSPGTPILALSLLLLSRVVLGVGESYIIIGIFAWGFKLVGKQHMGRVIVWNGMGMYGGLAIGAPVGIYLQEHFSIVLPFMLVVLFPLLGYLTMRTLPQVKMEAQQQGMSLVTAVKLIWKSGTGLALASIGFGSLASFVTLFFAQQDWNGAPFAITAFGAGYIGMRIFFSGYPDRFGGAKIALYSLLAESAGLLLIWLADSPSAAIFGAFLTGIGISLVFPAFGLIAIAKVKAENRGMAMAAYNAFFDLGVGITGPLAGWVANTGYYGNIYLMGAVATVLSAGLALSEIRKTKKVG